MKGQRKSQEIAAAVQPLPPIFMQVSAYGFITEGHERFSDHYYDKTWKRLIFYLNHDFRLERAVWKRLHDEGIIRLYQRPQSTNAKN